MSITQNSFSSAPAGAIAATEADPTVEKYFATLNQGDFAATAVLFATDGVLDPPLAAGIIGPTAIAEYLAQEAQGIQLLPTQQCIKSLADGTRQIQVHGQVQTPLFSIQASWSFRLNAQGKILQATIQLLASPQELLQLQ